MSDLFSSFKQRMQNRYRPATGLYQLGTIDQDPTLSDEISREKVSRKIDLESAQSMVGSNRQASDARSAFAQGAASRSKKLFRPKGSGNYAAIGRTEAATQKALADKKKAVADIELLEQSQQNKSPLISIGQPIRLW